MVEVTTENLVVPSTVRGRDPVHPSGCPVPRSAPSRAADGTFIRRPNRQAAKSVIAAAMKYAADHNETVVDAVDMVPPKPVKVEKVPMGAPPGYSRAQTSIFSAFGQGDSSAWTGVSSAELRGYETQAGGGGMVQVSAPGGGAPSGAPAGGFYSTSTGNVMHVGAPLELAKQCSMVHRMMETEKNDVDPRDVHKLLPGTMMASDSLDLHSELIQGKINQVIHDIMDAQTLQEMEFSALNQPREIPIMEEEPHHYADAQVSQLTRLMPSIDIGMDPNVGHEGLSSPECMSPVQSTMQQRTRAPMRLSPTPPPLPPRSRSVQGLRSTYSAPSPVPPAGTVSVTGWPAAPVLGIVHPNIQGRVSPAPLARGPSPVLGRRSTVPAAVTTPVAAFPDAAVQVGARYAVVNSNAPAVQVGSIPVQYVYAQAPKFQNQDTRSSSRLSCRSPISEPVLESPMGEDRPRTVFAMSPEPTRKAMTPIPGQRVTMVEPDSADSDAEKSGSDDEGKASKSARKFRSLEAALAWCHVQHSQKHVPVVPKDDVKKLVEFQLKNGRPIRAPWYRPNKPEDEEGSDDEVSQKEDEEEVSQASPKSSGSNHSETINEITQQAQASEESQVEPVHHPQVQSRMRVERPRCESAPLVRSWKQPPKHVNQNRRAESRVGNNKPPGTGFFCPPGFEFPSSAATPTAL